MSRVCDAAVRQRTEAEMLALLREFHCSADGVVTANGGQFVFVEHVRDRAGFDGERTIDGLAMAMWKRDGRLLHGFEVKCSRADWLTELRTPAKAQAWCALVDRFWLVVADEVIVREGELPEGWGLLAVRDDALVVVVEAGPLRVELGKPERLPLPPGWDRAVLASALRAAVRVDGGRDGQAVAG